jgi:hypothetical protein
VRVDLRDGGERGRREHERRRESDSQAGGHAAEPSPAG